jgi:predicted NBD/HSP70 family sugar kinase
MSALQGQNSPAMKARNRSIVLKLLLERGPLPRRDMAEFLALTPATMTNVVRELIALGLVEERADMDVTPVGAARRSILIDVRPDGAYAVGVNMGISGAQVSLVDLRGNVRTIVDVPYDERAPELLVPRIAAAIRRLAGEAGTDRTVGVGVGVAGVVEPRRGMVRAHLSLGWRDVPLADLLGWELGVRPIVVNNVHAMTVSEHLFGVAAGANNFAFVFVSTVIGAGLMIDGGLVPGHASAGLIGHVRVVPDGPLCRCGSRGCLEAVASHAAIAREAERAIEAGQATSLRGRLPAATPGEAVRVLHEAAREGDRLAASLVGQQARYVGIGLAALFHLLDPEIVVLAVPIPGGQLDLEAGAFLETVRETVRDQAPLLDDPDRRIVVSRFGSEATVRGAAAVSLADFLDRAPFSAPVETAGRRLTSGIA